MTPEQAFTEITKTLSEQYEHVTPGKMMSSEGIKVNGKVFCFFHDEEMCFKLGKDVDLSRPELAGAHFLSPFKNKPPMKAWLYIPFVEKRIWELLAEEAMRVTEESK